MAPISGPIDRQVHSLAGRYHAVENLGPFNSPACLQIWTKINDLTNVDQCELCGDALVWRVKGVPR